MLKFIVTLLSTLGVGLIPFAPGTWGSLVAAVLWWFILPLGLAYQLLLIVSAFALGLWSTHNYEKLLVRHDPKEVVVDELVGLWITLLAAPKMGLFFVVGFLLFRLFDIWKPWPIGWVDKTVPGAFGTLLDDVLAGVFALVLVQLGWWGFTHGSV